MANENGKRVRCEQREEQPLLSKLDANPWIFRTLPAEYQDDRSIAFKAVLHVPELLQFASERLRNDKQFLMDTLGAIYTSNDSTSEDSDSADEHYSSLVNCYRRIVQSKDFKYATPRLQALFLVELDPLHLRDSEESFGDDEEIVLAAVCKKAHLMECASNRLRNSRDFLLRAISVNGGVYEDMPERTRADRDFALAAVKQNGRTLQSAPAALQADGEIVQAAVQRYGLALGDASDTLKGDCSIVQMAVNQNGRALEHTLPEIQGDHEIVLVAIRQNGLALQYATGPFGANRDYVKIAVQQNGLAIKYAVSQLRADPEIARIAVEGDGYALED